MDKIIRENADAFSRAKTALLLTTLFAGMGFASSYLAIENSQLWFDLLKITIGFLLGTGVSAGYSR